jgi:hypothetical protein
MTGIGISGPDIAPFRHNRIKQQDGIRLGFLSQIISQKHGLGAFRYADAEGSSAAQVGVSNATMKSAISIYTQYTHASLSYRQYLFTKIFRIIFTALILATVNRIGSAAVPMDHFLIETQMIAQSPGGFLISIGQVFAVFDERTQARTG